MFIYCPCIYTRWGIITGPPWFLLYIPLNKYTKIDKILDYAAIGNNNILNYWLSLYSKCSPFTLTHAWRSVRHCLTAVSITHWSSSSQAVRIRERSSSTSLIRPLVTLHSVLPYLVLSRGNFYAEKQHSNKVLPFGARESGNYASPCSFSIAFMYYVFCCHLA